MEICSWLCMLGASVYIFTVLRTPKDGCGYWHAALGALVGAFLYFLGYPGLCGGVALGCSLTLLHGSERRRELLPVQNRVVLITGFGHALAKQLSDMGVKVFAGVLDVHGAGAQQLRARGCANLEVLQLDVTDGSQIAAAHQCIRAQVRDAGLWGLVNNAGILHTVADAELHPLLLYRRIMEVNFLGAVNMCQVFLPLLKRSRGRIINVSSVAGEVPMPLLAAYGASKAALSSFSKALRLELSAWGVRVAVIQPGGFKTNIYGNSDDILTGISSETREDYGEEYILSLVSNMLKMSQQLSEDLSPVVDDMCHALLAVRPRPLYTPGPMAWLLPFLQCYCPTAVFDSIIMRILKNDNCEPAGLSRR
uniref:17-beta-hydroxysteroid dehydrogenase type 2 isoform X2 n=1 Tax=Monopterus albus TaxID=43700 RepID=UPI0009B3703C|nr:estradiol 17-beta-dehydrogenase 2 isoform X2 [Monopterus albus]